MLHGLEGPSGIAGFIGWVQVIKGGDSADKKSRGVSCSARKKKGRVQQTKQVATTTLNMGQHLVDSFT